VHDVVVDEEGVKPRVAVAEFDPEGHQERWALRWLITTLRCWLARVRGQCRR
jgi:hypothetical protein